MLIARKAEIDIIYIIYYEYIMLIEYIMSISNSILTEIYIEILFS